MSVDEALRRADELLSELIEVIETARAVPMSASCVVPARAGARPARRAARGAAAGDGRGPHRHRPPRPGHARRARERRRRPRAGRRRGRHRARRRRAPRRGSWSPTPSCGAQETVDAARAEHGRLVAATTVHQAAASAAAALREDTERYQRQVTPRGPAVRRPACAPRPTATRTARATEAEMYATKLTADAEDYAERTLDELAAVLNRSAQTAEQGRQALAQRRAAAWTPTVRARATDRRGRDRATPRRGRRDARPSRPDRRRRARHAIRRRAPSRIS